MMARNRCKPSAGIVLICMGTELVLLAEVISKY
jgi:hypothetical protein